MTIPKIAVVGCGIGGLTAAAFLAQNNYDVTLFEKFDHPKPVGAGLLLQPTGLACLQQLGVIEKILDFGAPIHHLDGQSVQGSTIFNLDYALLHQMFGLGIHRSSLFSILYEEVKRLGLEIQTHCDIVDAKIEHDQRMLINTHGEAFGPFDLVVDASGYHSILREKFATLKLNRPYPYGAIWGVCTNTNNTWDQHALKQRYDQAKVMIGMLPIGKAPGDDKEHLAFFWSLPSQSYRQWRQSPFQSWQQRVINYWPEIEPMVKQFHDHNDLVMSNYSDIILQQWHTERMVFIGDAGHSMSPQLGQGANLAIMDAMALCQCLKQHQQVKSALVEYSRCRRGHLRFYQTASRWLTPFFQSNSTLAAWLRDRTFGLMCQMPYLKTEMIHTLSGSKTGLFSHLDLKKSTITPAK